MTKRAADLALTITHIVSEFDFGVQRLAAQGVRGRIDRRGPAIQHRERSRKGKRDLSSDTANRPAERGPFRPFT